MYLTKFKEFYKIFIIFKILSIVFPKKVNPLSTLYKIGATNNFQISSIFCPYWIVYGIYRLPWKNLESSGFEPMSQFRPHWLGKNFIFICAFPLDRKILFWFWQHLWADLNKYFLHKKTHDCVCMLKAHNCL